MSVVAVEVYRTEEWWPGLISSIVRDESASFSTLWPQAARRCGERAGTRTSSRGSVGVMTTRNHE